MKDLPHHQKIERPWGNFEQFTLNEKTTVKILTVNAGESISLQTHENRDEFLHVINGNPKITIGEDVREGKAGESFFCPRGTKHRVEVGEDGAQFLEIAFGDFDENDIKRLADRYGRVGDK